MSHSSLNSSPTTQSFYPLTTSTNRPSPSPTKRSYISPNSSPNLNVLGEIEISLHSNNNNLGGKKIQFSNSNSTSPSSNNININSNRNELNVNQRTKLTEVDLNVLNNNNQSQQRLNQINQKNKLEQEEEEELDIRISSNNNSKLNLSSDLEELYQSAELQTKKLYDMPIERSTILSKLCSQHRTSQYNTLKRTVTESIQIPPINFLSNPSLPPSPSTVPTNHLEVRPSMNTRSQSNPVISTTASTTSTGFTFIPSTPPHAQPQSNDVNSSSGTSTPIASVVNELSPLKTNGLVIIESNSNGTTGLTPTVSQIKVGNTSIETSAPTSTIDKVESVVTENLSGSSKRVEGEVIVPAILKMNLLPGMRIMNGIAVKTSVSHPMNITPLIPPEFIQLLSSHILKSSLPSTSTTSPTTTRTKPILLSSPTLSFDLWDISSQPTSFTPLIDSLPPLTSSTKLMGNFYLSSCPGKKVRLGGVVDKNTSTTLSGATRGAICRSVSLDLSRAKALGITLIICCLNDEELLYLGSPWLEYSKAAFELGLKVIRIPMLEGFAPNSIPILDENLEMIIKNFTLKGEGVLAHCRGGIGRAGLVSCCWMIKLGLVKEFELDELLGGTSTSNSGGGNGNGSERRGLGNELKVLERVIEIIRRRRSVKSIETPQQVHFLLDYITFLKQQAEILRVDEL